MSLLDATVISRLQIEFRRSMRSLIPALCREIEHSPRLADEFALPLEYFRFLGDRLDLSAYSNWKVVGWIEGLNDFMYFLDVLAQSRRERDRRGFADELFMECEQKFFENSYLDDLFPPGQPPFRGLTRRLQSLCRRLALEITQESIFLDPEGPFHWMKRRHRPWAIQASFEPSFERAEQGATIPLGFEGRALIAPGSVRKAVGRRPRLATFVVTNDHITVRANGTYRICTRHGNTIQWHWSIREPFRIRSPGRLTIGPTLHYGSDREPKSLTVTEAKQIARIDRAWQAIRRAWPEGHALLALLTSRVIPLAAHGVVSFSYRHRPGLSFINCFDRDNLDLIDDLVHENSHHHLNLLLRKHVLYRGDRNEQIFYSPWRRSLRPLRGILHATFTFTMGAVLFARLSAWAETRDGRAQWREAGLTAHQLVRARFRCFEEIESVRYSLLDLAHARRLKWITHAGARLVTQLEEVIMKADRQIARHRHAVLDSSFGPSLRRHVVELAQARRTYGPMNLDQA
ncbi:MAG TPA: HEXXH motif-containing putative peptide modification protein [Nitrospira sp.]|nr:HEXXH motif-containing putative peptide modification protein [Nitrospira sp.]